MTELTKLMLDAPLEIEGRGGVEQNTVVLEVRGGSSQTEPLQRWENAVGDVLAELTSRGELRVGGEVAGSLPSALVEADAQISVTSDKPKRGWQSRGEIVGEIADVIRWAVHELSLLSETTISGIHSALRAQVTIADNDDPDLDAQNLEVHAAEFEVVNNTGSETKPVGRIVGVQVALTNDTGAHLTEAVGLEVAEPINGGAVSRLVGLQIADLGASEEGAERYAIWTGRGRVRLADVLELVEPAPLDPELAQSVQVYVKADGGLYARDMDEVEYNLLTGGTGTGSRKMAILGW